MNWLFIFLILTTTCLAQDPPPMVQQQMEEWAEANEKEEIDDDSRIQQLEYFKRHPLNLNTAAQEDLEDLCLLSRLQIFHLLEYRRMLGEFIDIYELQAVPGFDLVSILKVIPYIKVESADGLGAIITNRLKEGKQQLILRWSKTLERSKGFNTDLNDHFLGDGNNIYLRYRYQSKFIQFGITAEKDKGEQFFKGAQSKGFDFYSFHMFLKNKKKFKAVAVGDFVVNLGQGLVHWQSMGNGKGMQMLNAKREAPMIAPYRSAGEFNFLRGAGVQYKIQNFYFLLFLSYRKLTANLSDSSETFSAFNTSGLHRTQNEIADRNKIGFCAAGTAIQFSRPYGKLGIYTTHYSISKDLEQNNQPYNQYKLKGQEYYFIGLDYSGTYKNLHFFGELAIDKGKHRAYTHGMIVSLDAKVDLAFQFRKMAKEFQPFFGNSFSENGVPGNEEGLFSGIIIKPVRGLIIHAFTDVFSFPWLRYRVDAPTKGSEFLAAMEYQPTRKSSIQVIFRSRQKPVNGNVDNFQFPFFHTRKTLRLHWSSQISKALQLRSRFEISNYSKGIELPETGTMFFMEGVVKKRIFQWGLRVQWFDTETYNSRIYSYEADVLFSSSISSVSDQGIRYYINTKFDFTKELSFSARIARSVFFHKSSIGSGYNTINGNKITDVRLQILIEF